MKTIKAEPCFQWECPECHTLNYLEENDFIGERHEKNHSFQWCVDCDTKVKVEQP